MEGYFAKDNFLFKDELTTESANNNENNHVFGCADEETGEFYNQQADGIIGIGSTPYSDPPNILETEYLENRIQGSRFALCLGHDGGKLTFGDWNSDLHLKSNGPQQGFNIIKTESLGSNAWDKQ